MLRTLLVALAAASPLAMLACSSAEDEPALEVEDLPPPPVEGRPQERGHQNPTNAALEASAPDASPASESLPPVPSCVLDTRTVYVERGRKIESITAYGHYWSRVLDAAGSSTEGAGFPRTVADEPKFAEGPCAAATSACTLDTRVVYFDGPTKLESTTANGSVHLWTFAPEGAHLILPGHPRALATTYAYPKGPCEDAGFSCRFDTRAIEVRGGATIETITAYGQWYEALVAADGTRTRYDDGPRYLDDIARLATGPCRGQTAKACVLDTRTVYRDLDGTRMEEITAQGRLWAFRLSETDEVRETVAAGTPLASIPRFSSICGLVAAAGSR
jgi:hypothetical protein